jgi:crotonyl-CoA carboxylase/reductase
VLVLVMAAGVNYNGVWAGLGQPISPFDGHGAPYHIAGSDAAGIVWAVGDKVKNWKVGDEVVIHCNQDDGDDEECNGGDPMFSPTSGSGATRRPTAPSRSSPACRRSS